MHLLNAESVRYLLNEKVLILKIWFQCKNFQASAATRLRGEMSRIMEFFTKATLPQYRLEGSSSPNHVVALFIRCHRYDSPRLYY